MNFKPRNEVYLLSRLLVLLGQVSMTLRLAKQKPVKLPDSNTGETIAVLSHLKKHVTKVIAALEDKDYHLAINESQLAYSYIMAHQIPLKHTITKYSKHLWTYEEAVKTFRTVSNHLEMPPPSARASVQKPCDYLFDS